MVRIGGSSAARINYDQYQPEIQPEQQVEQPQDLNLEQVREQQLKELVETAFKDDEEWLRLQVEIADRQVTFEFDPNAQPPQLELDDEKNLVDDPEADRFFVPASMMQGRQEVVEAIVDVLEDGIQETENRERENKYQGAGDMPPWREAIVNFVMEQNAEYIRELADEATRSGASRSGAGAQPEPSQTTPEPTRGQIDPRALAAGQSLQARLLSQFQAPSTRSETQPKPQREKPAASAPAAMPLGTFNVRSLLAAQPQRVGAPQASTPTRTQQPSNSERSGGVSGANTSDPGATQAENFLGKLGQHYSEALVSRFASFLAECAAGCICMTFTGS